jgi:hypothetical protein
LIGAGRFALGRIGGQRRIHHLRSVNAHIPQPQPQPLPLPLHSATQRLP